ncbi:MAG: hypothetical protein WDW36_005415 [Sanguina aurantia]
MKPETRALWEQLFADVTLFDDLRAAKAMMGGNMVAIPDFRHKESEACLWLTSKFPLPVDIAARIATLPPAKRV